MRNAALAYLGLNQPSPAVEFEIRLPKSALTIAARTQIELTTDRNQKLAIRYRCSDALRNRRRICFDGKT